MGPNALSLALVAGVGFIAATLFFQSTAGNKFVSGASVAATIVYTGLTYKLISEGRRAEARRRDHDDSVDERNRDRLEATEQARRLGVLDAVRCELSDNLRVVGRGFQSMDAAPDVSWRYLDEAIPIGGSLPEDLHNQLHQVRYDLVMYQTALDWWRTRSAQRLTGLATFDGIVGPGRSAVTESATVAQKSLVSYSMSFRAIDPAEKRSQPSKIDASR